MTISLPFGDAIMRLVVPEGEDPGTAVNRFANDIFRMMKPEERDALLKKIEEQQREMQENS